MTSTLSKQDARPSKLPMPKGVVFAQKLRDKAKSQGIKLAPIPVSSDAQRLEVRIKTLSALEALMSTEASFQYMKAIGRSDLCPDCGGTGKKPYWPPHGYMCTTCHGHGKTGAYLPDSMLQKIKAIGPDQFAVRYKADIEKQNTNDWLKRNKSRREFELYELLLAKFRDEQKKHAYSLAAERDMMFAHTEPLGIPGEIVTISGLVMQIACGIRPALTGFNKSYWYLTIIKMVNGHEIVWWNKFDDVHEGDWITFNAMIKISGKCPHRGVRRTEVLGASLTDRTSQKAFWTAKTI